MEIALIAGRALIRHNHGWHIEERQVISIERNALTMTPLAPMILSWHVLAHHFYMCREKRGAVEA